MASGYFLKLRQFEGPLDLLIHLIRVNEIDIFDIDIFLLTTQYLEYLRLFEFDDLGNAGEFIEMAATLVEIKARMLLPREEKAPGEEDEDDPRRELQEQLLEKERFTTAADHFSRLPQLGVDIQTGKEWRRLEPLYEDVEAPLTGEAASLVILYEQMLKNLAERKPPARVQAVTHLVSVEEKINEIETLLGTVNFALFQSFYQQLASRYELVVYILAMLEMARWGRAKIYQEEMNGPVWLYDINFNVDELPSNRLRAGSVRPAQADAALPGPAPQAEEGLD